MLPPHHLLLHFFFFFGGEGGGWWRCYFINMSHNLGLVQIFSFFNHSSLITQSPSLITHHSSLKIPQFPIPIRLANIFNFSSLNFFLLFVGPIPKQHVKHSCQPTRLTAFHYTISSQNQRLQPRHSFFSFFLFFSFNPQYPQQPLRF